MSEEGMGTIRWADLQATLMGVMATQKEREVAAGPPPPLPEGIVIDQLGGYCPVQGEGRIDGHEFYYRARHNHQSLEVMTAPGVPFSWEDREAQPWFSEEAHPNASWITEAEATAYIIRAAGRFRAGEPTGSSHRQAAESVAWVQALTDPAGARVIVFDERAEGGDGNRAEG